MMTKELKRTKQKPNTFGCVCNPKHPVKDTNRVWLKKKENIFPWEYIIG